MGRNNWFFEIFGIVFPSWYCANTPECSRAHDQLIKHIWLTAPGCDLTSLCLWKRKVWQTFFVSWLYKKHIVRRYMDKMHCEQEDSDKVLVGFWVNLKLTHKLNNWKHRYINRCVSLRYTAFVPSHWCRQATFNPMNTESRASQCCFWQASGASMCVFKIVYLNWQIYTRFRCVLLLCSYCCIIIVVTPLCKQLKHFTVGLHG